MCIYKKTSYIKKQGVLWLLPIPIQRWRDISIDFIVDLPSSNGFTNIIVVIDHLIKMRHIVPIDSINAVLVAEYFVRYIFKLYRLPNLIVSDCGN
jgi:hypothetical protein